MQTSASSQISPSDPRLCCTVRHQGHLVLGGTPGVLVNRTARSSLVTPYPVSARC